MRGLRVGLAAVGVVGVLAAASCGSGSGGRNAPFELARSPEFVHRLVPGHRPLAVVSAVGGSGGTATLSGASTLTGMRVSFVPATLAPDASAEVWVDIPEVTEETPFTVTVRTTRGKEQRSIAIDATAVPGVDDLGDTAEQIAKVFLGRLHDQVAGLPADPSGLVNGTPVAGLLVVMHYAWFTEEYEIGLAWHIMVAPYDFAELYVRPRNAVRPTHTFRIDSWSAAIAGGDYQLQEVAANTEVVR